MNHILLLKCAATVVFFVAILTEFYILHTFSSNIQWIFQFNKYQYKQLLFFCKREIGTLNSNFFYSKLHPFTPISLTKVYLPPTCKKVLGETTVKIILQQRQLGRFQGPSTSTYSKF